MFCLIASLIISAMLVSLRDVFCAKMFTTDTVTVSSLARTSELADREEGMLKMK
jgi:hypothetical protein